MHNHRQLLHKSLLLIQTKTFRTNGMGEEYSIKETCDTADKACAGKNQGSFEKYFF